MAEIFNSFEDALSSLDLGDRLELKLVRRACNDIAAAHGLNDWDGRRAARANAFNLFQRQIPISNKGVRYAQVNGTSQICFFYDCYDVHWDVVEQFVDVCRDAGLNVVPFQKDYPRGRFHDDYHFAPPGNRIVSLGYDRFYRGTLLGIIIG